MVLKPHLITLAISVAALVALTACQTPSGLKQSFEASIPVDGRITFTD